MWFPVDVPWQFRVLDAMPPSVDVAQLEAARKLTPTERIDAVMKLQAMCEQLAAARARTP